MRKVHATKGQLARSCMRKTKRGPNLRTSAAHPGAATEAAKGKEKAEKENEVYAANSRKGPVRSRSRNVRIGMLRTRVLQLVTPCPARAAIREIRLTKGSAVMGHAVLVRTSLPLRSSQTFSRTTDRRQTTNPWWPRPRRSDGQAFERHW